MTIRTFNDLAAALEAAGIEAIKISVSTRVSITTWQGESEVRQQLEAAGFRNVETETTFDDELCAPVTWAMFGLPE